MRELGISKQLLVPVALSVSAANNAKMALLGGLFLNIMIGTKDTNQLVYITKEVCCLFLSHTACEGLRLVNEDFPHKGHTVKACTATENEEDNGRPCTCPTRIRSTKTALQTY
jgi:hypothetical protein